MISEYELNGVDCDPPKEVTPTGHDDAADLAAMAEGQPRDYEAFRRELMERKRAEWKAGEVNDAEKPQIVRDVQADMANHKCCDCGNPLENEATIHLHLGKLYCSRCYHAEAGS